MSLQMSSLPTFHVSINGLQMQAMYDCNSAFSSISLRFCTTLSLSFLSNSQSLHFLPLTFMIVTSTGSFTSTLSMHVSKDQIEDVIFGRDCFNFCAVEPFATMDLIEPGMCLSFAGGLPQSCIRARSSLGQFTSIIPL